MSINSLDHRTGAAGSPSGVRSAWGGTPSSGASSFGLNLSQDSAESSLSMDRLQVDLPNGFSVSATHIGGGSAGFSTQMLASMQDMVGYLSTIQPTGEGPPSGAPANARCIDTFGVPMSDGTTAEVHYGTEGDGGNTDPSAMAAMQKAIETMLGRYQNAGPPASQPSLAELYQSLTAGAA